MANLPEEILEMIIDYAVPDETSVVRNGKRLELSSNYQRLLLISKQFQRITHSIYYSRPLRIYVTDHRYVCELMCQPFTFWARLNGSCRLPLHRFGMVELHFHPELSFIDLQHETREVVSQSDWDGISTEASDLSKAMQKSRIPGLVSKGQMNITIKFHEACPFHNPVSYANAKKLPPHHIPFWDVQNIWRILYYFRWIFQPIDTLVDLRKLVTFPNIAWTAPDSRGQFDGKDLGPDFLFNLNLLDVWDGSTNEHDELAAEAWRYFEDVWGPESTYDLQRWVARFKDPQYLPYNISPHGKVSELQRAHIGMMVDAYYKAAEQIAVFDPRSTGTDELIHEWKLLRSILSEMRRHFCSAMSSLDDFQLLVAHARLEAFRPVLTAILIGMKLWTNRWVETPNQKWSPDQASDRIHDQLLNLKRLGLWDGKWKDMDEGSHLVTRSDQEFEHFWCRCGREISLDLEDIEDWKEYRYPSVDKLLRQMEGTFVGLS